MPQTNTGMAFEPAGNDAEEPQNVRKREKMPITKLVKEFDWLQDLLDGNYSGFPDDDQKEKLQAMLPNRSLVIAALPPPGPTQKGSFLVLGSALS